MTKASVEKVKQMLEDEGYEIQYSPLVPESLRSLKGNLAQSQAFKNGYITVQDESSMLVAML